MRRLLEHQKFKAAAELLHEREQVRSAQWQRPDERVAELAGDDYEPELEVDLFSLLTRVPGGRRARQAAAEGAAAAEQMSGRGRASSSCSRGCRKPRRAASRSCLPTSHDRAGLIVTFLALLEMIRLKLVRVFQSGSFGPIRVYKRARPADAPHPIGDPEAHRG